MSAETVDELMGLEARFEHFGRYFEGQARVRAGPSHGPSFAVGKALRGVKWRE